MTGIKSTNPTLLASALDSVMGNFNGDTAVVSMEDFAGQLPIGARTFGTIDSLKNDTVLAYGVTCEPGDMFSTAIEHYRFEVVGPTAAFDLQTAGGVRFKVPVNGVINVEQFIACQDGGAAQVRHIHARDVASQDADIVTAGVQKAIVARSEAAGAPEVHFPFGKLFINDEFTAGVRGDGRTVAEWIYDGGLAVWSENLDDPFALRGHMWTTVIHCDRTFASSDPGPGKTVIRFVQDRKRMSGPLIDGFTFYWGEPRLDGATDLRHKCPTAIMAINCNFAQIKHIAVRGDDEWAGHAVLGENWNNSIGEDWRLRAGRQELHVDLYNETSFTADITTNGSRISATGMFSGTASSDWPGIFVAIGRDPTNPGDDTVKLVKIASKIDNNTLQIAAGWELPANLNNVVLGVERAKCATTAGSNAITFATAVLTADMEGEMIHVLRAGDASNPGKRGILSAYIKPGSITNGNKTCQLVEYDLTTPAKAEFSRSKCVVVFAPGIYLGQSHGMADGFNNEVHLDKIVNEKPRGTAFLIEQGSKVMLTNVKFHNKDTKSGQDNSGAEKEQGFTESGELMIFDNCPLVIMRNPILTWACGIDPLNEYGCAAQFFGSENRLLVDSVMIFGLMNRQRYFNFEPADGADQRIVFSGLGSIDNEDLQLLDRATGIGFELVSLDPSNRQRNARNLVDAQGEVNWRRSGSSEGHVDLLDRYRAAAANPTFAYTPELQIGGDDVTVGGGAYSSREGSWSIIGGKVFFWASVTLSAKGAGLGSVRFTLPFTPSDWRGPVDVTFFRDLAGDVVTDHRALGGRTLASGEAEIFIGSGTNGQVEYLRQNHLTDDTRIDIAGYFDIDGTEVMAVVEAMQ